MYRERYGVKRWQQRAKGSGFCFHCNDTQDQTSPALTSLSGVAFNTAFPVRMCKVRGLGALSVQVRSGPSHLSFKMCVESSVVIQGTGLNMVLGSFQDWGSEFYQRETPACFPQSHCCVLPCPYEIMDARKVWIQDYLLMRAIAKQSRLNWTSVCIFIF